MNYFLYFLTFCDCMMCLIIPEISTRQTLQLFSHIAHAVVRMRLVSPIVRLLYPRQFIRILSLSVHRVETIIFWGESRTGYIRKFHHLWTYIIIFLRVMKYLKNTGISIENQQLCGISDKLLYFVAHPVGKMTATRR